MKDDKMKDKESGQKVVENSAGFLQEVANGGFLKNIPQNKKIFIFFAVIAATVVFFLLLTVMPKVTGNNTNKFSESIAAALKQEEEAKAAAEAKVISTTTADSPWFSYSGSKIFFHSENFSGTTLVIPQKLNGVEISAVDGKSFGVKNKEVTDLELPDTLQTIESGAFKNFTALKNVVIPKGLNHIEGSAFKNTPWYKNISDDFYVCGNGVLIKYNGNGGNVTVPDGVKYLDCEVFRECESIQNLTMPDSVVYVGTKVFYDSSIKNIKPSPNISYVANDAFFGCSYVENIEDDFATIGKGCMIKYTISGNEIRIPETVREISGLDLEETGQDITLYIGKNVNKVADVAALGYVKKFRVSGGNTKFSTEDGALYNRNKTTLYRYPVYKSTEKYYAPEGLKVISARAFYGCDIKKTELVSSIYGIGSEAFKDCKNLEETDLPDSVVSLGDSAFEGCESLNSVYLSENISIIPYACFNGCKSLSNITLPDSVKAIRSKAFGNCEALKQMYFTANMRSVTPDSFYGCDTKYKISEKNTVLKIKNNKPVIVKAQTFSSSLKAVTSDDAKLKNGQIVSAKN